MLVAHQPRAAICSVLAVIRILFTVHKRLLTLVVTAFQPVAALLVVLTRVVNFTTRLHTAMIFAREPRAAIAILATNGVILLAGIVVDAFIPFAKQAVATFLLRVAFLPLLPALLRCDGLLLLLVLFLFFYNVVFLRLVGAFPIVAILGAAAVAVGAAPLIVLRAAVVVLTRFRAAFFVF